MRIIAYVITSLPADSGLVSQIYKEHNPVFKRDDKARKMDHIQVHISRRRRDEKMVDWLAMYTSHRKCVVTVELIVICIFWWQVRFRCEAVIFKVKEEELYDEINQWSSNLENHQ